MAFVRGDAFNSPSNAASVSTSFTSNTAVNLLVVARTGGSSIIALSAGALVVIRQPQIFVVT